MLYLHCGWPRTGTSSLQAALFECREVLGVEGLAYPREWLSATYPTHHGLAELLEGSAVGARRVGEPGGELARFLHGQTSGDVLLSAEVLTYWLYPRRKQDALFALVTEARSATAVRCVWTLRRFDELVASLYLLQLANGADLPPPRRYFETAPYLDSIFAGMARIERSAGVDTAYVKYERHGSHQASLLRAFGLSAEAARQVQAALARAPRLNGRLTQKQAIALLGLGELSRRAGVHLEQDALRQACYRGALRFERDQPCELVGGEVRRDLQDRALVAAEEAGLSSYCEYFAGAEIEPSSPVPLAPELIDETDLERIRAVAGPARVARR